MLQNILTKFKRTPPQPQAKEAKKKQVKEWISKTGINWCDIENLLFWKDPRISLAVFIIATGLFWKFIAYKLQKLGLIIIAFSLPCSFPETRTYIWQYFRDKDLMQVNPGRRNLGFDCDDVYEILADALLTIDQHYDYMKGLKQRSNVKLYFVAVSCISLLILMILYFPLAGMLYMSGTLLYFYPIFMYLNISSLFVSRMKKLIDPFLLHWSHSRTKRNRNRARRHLSYRRQKPDSDIENEEFIPQQKKECQQVLDDEINRHVSSSDHEELDEFQLRGEFLKKTEGHSSDYDEDSFLPSYNQSVNEMPSLSQFDSMMEPLDDEFHAGLDFRNVTSTTASFNVSHSNFGMPSDHDDDEVTSDDIDDIPHEDDSEQRKISDDKLFHILSGSVKSEKPSEDNYDDFEFDVDQEFEFLDRTELLDVTDEEIMEQNVGNHSHSQNVEY